MITRAESWAHTHGSPPEPAAPAPITAPRPPPQPLPLPPPQTKKKPLKPVCEVQAYAHFDDSRTDWVGKYHKVIGYSTRTIHFQYSFKLTDDLIDEILALSLRVTKNFRIFRFEHTDVSYTAHSGNSMTSKTTIRLAKACPELREETLQNCGACNDAVLLAFFAHCPKLQTLELTGGRLIDGSAFDRLTATPELARSLKLFQLTDNNDRAFMKSMKAMTKARPRMKVTLVSQSEIKKWGDWELETYYTTYKMGREFVERPKDEYWDYIW
ncbi:hypothetical protein K458DRAFT_483759 [Lentithecium fluviatile CBS 122367]|uniref:F-box domain-containing protein n=1 Tax=Lentithecium fluviatile CBS 122367 TaxID=1168545 RepID=A0A6G1JIK2_9PLEO|nr:hypothetical protein K458DRAFT_483759 [Lentithecium fluviatile CBS 122367]